MFLEHQISRMISKGLCVTEDIKIAFYKKAVFPSPVLKRPIPKIIMEMKVVATEKAAVALF